MFCTVNCKIYISLARSALCLAKSLVADFSANIVISCENRKAFNIKMSSRHVFGHFVATPTGMQAFPCVYAGFPHACWLWTCPPFGAGNTANTASLLCNYGVFASRFAAGMARGDLWRAVEKQQPPVPASCGGARNTGVMRIAAPRPCHCSAASAALFISRSSFRLRCTVRCRERRCRCRGTGRRCCRCGGCRHSRQAL